MITHIEGKLVEKTPAYAVIDCGGVGYFLNISLHTYSKLGENGNCHLYTHLAVREDAHVLYGFVEKEERNLFRHLISVSGVGPNTARMVLSALPPVELTNAIINGNISLLKSIKGIGPKTAQRIVIDLKDRLEKGGNVSSVSFMQDNKVREEALTALTMLGFARNAIEKVVDNILKKVPKGMKVEDLIKQALKEL